MGTRLYRYCELLSRGLNQTLAAVERMNGAKRKPRAQPQLSFAALCFVAAQSWELAELSRRGKVVIGTSDIHEWETIVVVEHTCNATL